MRICKVWDADYPWDVRVEKVASALTRAGHEVHIVAGNREGRPLTERLAEGTVHRLAPLPLVPLAVSQASMFPAFFNPRWAEAIRAVARLIDADLVLCRDLPLAIPSIRVARSLGIPCVMDMAEVYPEMLRSRWNTGRLGFTDFFVRNPRAADWVERWSIKRLDGIVVVIDESAQRLEKLGVPTRRIALASNTPPRARLDGPRASHETEHVGVVYLGLIELQRGLDVLLRAMARVREQGLRYRLTLIGDGQDLTVLKELSARLGMEEPDVRFLGRMANPQAHLAMAKAQIGVVPHWADESWNHTIPNKLFDYMAAGMAVVTSDAKPAARIVSDWGCGLVFRTGNDEHLAEQLIALREVDVRRRLGEQGRSAIAHEYNWETDSRRLIEFLERVAEKDGTPSRGAHRP